MRKLLLAAAPALLLGACAHRAPTGAGREEVGMASYYGTAFAGRRTACGQIYDPEAMVCAHPRLPCGTRVRVTALQSGAAVTVVVQDRGPFAKGRIIDLSLGAARRLGMLQAGVAKVRVERLP